MTALPFRVRLDRIRKLSESTCDYRFMRLDGERTDYEPGQFFRFVFTDDNGAFERSYSLCNVENLHSDILDLVISKVEGGRATNLLFNCDIGIEANLTGPFGRLVMPDPQPDHLVMVATSVGLAPYLPMLAKLAVLPNSERPSKVTLLLGVRDRSEFIYRDYLLEYAAAHDDFDLKLCLSREAPTESYERTGYVNAQLESMALSPKKHHVLLCGNPNMIDNAWDYLKGLGFGSKQVVREKYVFAKEAKKEAKALTDEQKKLIAEKMKKYQK